jgi:serine/threonine protein kinase
LIDFGSAVIVDPAQPRPFYKHFFGTKAYAPPEVLLEQPYQAAPAEVWALGMLLSYLLTGTTPFPTDKDAIEGRIVLNDPLEQGKPLILSSACLLLLSRCLQPDPAERADIHEVRMHQWLQL